MYIDKQEFYSVILKNAHILYICLKAVKHFFCKYLSYLKRKIIKPAYI